MATTCRDGARARREVHEGSQRQMRDVMAKVLQILWRLWPRGAAYWGIGDWRLRGSEASRLAQNYGHRVEFRIKFACAGMGWLRSCRQAKSSRFEGGFGERANMSDQRIKTDNEDLVEM